MELEVGIMDGWKMNYHSPVGIMHGGWTGEYNPNIWRDNPYAWMGGEVGIMDGG
jgi:hypothetical protein